MADFGSVLADFLNADDPENEFVSAKSSFSQHKIPMFSIDSIANDPGTCLRDRVRSQELFDLDEDEWEMDNIYGTHTHAIPTTMWLPGVFLSGCLWLQRRLTRG